MNRFFMAVVMALFLGSIVVSSAATTSSTPVVSKNPNTHQINLRLKHQMTLILLGKKSGKFTADQAKSLRAGLKSIRKQEVGFFKLNGNKELTTDQQTQLNQAMNANSAALGETPIN